jgi:hypothetical protein
VSRQAIQQPVPAIATSSGSIVPNLHFYFVPPCQSALFPFLLPHPPTHFGPFLLCDLSAVLLGHRGPIRSVETRDTYHHPVTVVFAFRFFPSHQIHPF